MSFKLKFKVKLIRIWDKFLNFTKIGWWISDKINFFRENGFWYGLKLELFPPMSTEKFIKKMINFELRHYKGIDYDYLKSLPLKPCMPHQKIDQTKKEFDVELWDYLYRMYYIFDNIYSGYPREFQDDWTNKYKFKTIKEYIQFEKYYYKLYPKTKSWKVEKQEIEQSFSWFNLQYGLQCDFHYEEIEKYKNKHNKKWN